jgi:hypothetical protein
VAMAEGLSFDEEYLYGKTHFSEENVLPLDKYPSSK